eukprot:CAMPEP_0177771744 /NCGR_PEP_ID=MMETSP0491_2-20121128/11795_1 /TAXON_ID=63592 /ORGANISM="Tetraselmis chuii, Strain PLY429" /LENGTH=426 /DNA_ID=CAMNT_0019289393 /DNA_START=258 /DNA_END=1539 /DNA_ORIENTATION=-
MPMSPMTPNAFGGTERPRSVGTPNSGRRTFKEKLMDDISAAEASSAQEALLSKPADRSSLSIACLVEGYPHAFVDFFTLTHSSDSGDGLPSAEELMAQGVDPGSYVVSEYERMERLRVRANQLVVADAARRVDDRQGTYEAYNNLAHYYEEQLYISKAIFFYHKCVEIAGSDWPEGEMAATLAIGLAYEKVGNIEEAIKYHERHLEISASLQGEHAETETANANQNLMHTYSEQARKHETAGDHDSSVAFLTKMLESANKCGSMEDAADANYRLGLSFQQQRKHEGALDYFQEFLRLCSTAGDKVGEGRAYCSIAKCMQSLGNNEGAIVNLEQYLELSKAMDPAGQAKAFCLLGNIMQQEGNYEGSVTYFEKFFDVARTLQDRQLLDTARINLGIARGMAQMDGFMDTVSTDLSSLLQWKNIRLPF